MTPYYVYTRYKIMGDKNPLSEDKWMNRLSDNSIEEFTKLSDKFITVWQNIDIDTYMSIGWKLWKTFTVNNLNNNKIIKEYIKQDKKKKRCIDYSEKDIYNELSSLKRLYGSLNQYCIKRNPIEDFTKNKICSLTLMYLIMYKYIIVSSLDKNYLSYIYNRYNTLKSIIHNMTSLEEI